MLQLYIKHTDNNYHLLDLESSELINFKLTVKDLTDITKVFSPFTQYFNLKATDKNKILCGFIGNEKIQRSNLTGNFDAMIYISGFLFQSGILSFEETDYEFKDQKTFKTNFASNLTSLTDKLGDLTIQDLFKATDGSFEDAIKIGWTSFTVKKDMASIAVNTLANGIELKYGIPFISNDRVWSFNSDNLDAVDNIAFKKDRTAISVNQISPSEVRPAVSYMTIMRHLIKKIGATVEAPIFDRPEVKDLFVWCNSESLMDADAKAIPLINYEELTFLRYETKDDGISGVSFPSATNPRWLITGGGASGIFKATRNATGFPNNWSDGFDINLKFIGLTPLEGTETKIKVVLKNSDTGLVLDSQEISTGSYIWRMPDSMLGIAGEIFFKFEILPMTLMSWGDIEMKTVHAFRYERSGLFGLVSRVVRAKYSATALNKTDSFSLGGNKLNLITTLPKMKCVDFLKSFFKTFNISVVSTGKQDQSMYWVTPSDIKEENKAYSKRIVDYTRFTDVSALSKKKASQYNQYSFSHFASKYYGEGSVFGALNYPEDTPTKPTKFEVKTDYSILNQRAEFNHPSGAKTCFGFSNDAPTILDNGGVRYKPVYEEFTLFYLQPIRLGADALSIEYRPFENAKLFGVLEASFKNSFNGKLLTFGAVNEDTDSLYFNYYLDFIELLLEPNTYQSSFTLTLPPNEIFLNFANLTQGEDNIPTGFRAQNEIVIGEQRYQLIDSSIDLTSGRTKLTLLNF